jgi:SPP1 family predicted phage head-tail adaptor
MVVLKAGELNTRATFLHATKTKAANGQMIDTWVDAFTVPAKKTTTGGKEFYAAQKKNAETTALFTIRYTQRVNATMRVRHGNSTFEILPPINDTDNAHVELLISAKEVV